VRTPVFLIILLTTALGGAAVTPVTHAETVPLASDADMPTNYLGEVAPGVTVKMLLPYDVYLSGHGDDEKVDSEIKLLNYDLRVGYGDDDVKVVLTEDGQLRKEKVVAVQESWWGEEYRGSVEVIVSVDCDGNAVLKIDGETWLTFHLNDKASIYGDDDVKVVKVSVQKCADTTSSPGDDVDLPEVEPSHNTLFAGVGLAIALVAIVLVIALGGGKHGG